MDYIDRFANELKNEEKDIYFYGAGFIAKKTAALLKSKGIVPKGYVVDNQYLPKDVNKRSIDGNPIISPDNLTKDCILIDAIQLKKTPVKLPKNEHIKKYYRIDLTSYVVHGAYSESFMVENSQKLATLYDKLCDTDSRCALANFISQKFTGWYNKPFSRHEPYFDKDIFLPKENETIIDCGAYDGDTFLIFLDFLKKNNVSSYRKYIAFEPDEKNYERLLKNLSNYSNIDAYNLGTYFRKDKLHFSSGMGTGSSIQNEGDTIVEVDSIDNIVSDLEVTYIKMDIEGAELDSLKGAENTIRKYHPKLAICVYHKMDDLLTIPNYIMSLHQDYRLYLRNYHPSGIETVLYAI